MSNKANWSLGLMRPRQKAKAKARLVSVCAGCGFMESLTLAHKLARAHGGTNSIGNHQLLCGGLCNFARSLVEHQSLAAALVCQTTTFTGEQ